MVNVAIANSQPLMVTMEHCKAFSLSQRICKFLFRRGYLATTEKAELYVVATSYQRYDYLVRSGKTKRVNMYLTGSVSRGRRLGKKIDTQKHQKGHLN